MPSRYAQDAARLKAEIVARVEAGEPLRAVCASPGMPVAPTVRTWAKVDPLFGEALAAARRRGTWRRLWAFDEARAAAFLARAQAGEPIKSLLGQPGMPTRRTYDRWRTAQAPFAEATFALSKRRDAKLGEQGYARWRAFDQALADRIIVRMHGGLSLKAVLKADPELPGRNIVARWRREQPQFGRVLRMIAAAQRAAMKPVPELLAEEVVSHILQGGTFASFSRLPGGWTHGTLRRWLRDPNFAAQVARACDGRDAWMHEDMLRVVESTPPGPVREMNRGVGRMSQHLARLGQRAHPPKQKNLGPRLRGDERD